MSLLFRTKTIYEIKNSQDFAPILYFCKLTSINVISADPAMETHQASLVHLAVAPKFKTTAFQDRTLDSCTLTSRVSARIHQLDLYQRNYRSLGRWDLLGQGRHSKHWTAPHKLATLEQQNLQDHPMKLLYSARKNMMNNKCYWTFSLMICPC